MSKPIEQADAQVTPAVAQIQQRNFKEKFQSLCRFCRSPFDDLARAGALFRSARRLELGKGRVGDARNPGQEPVEQGAERLLCVQMVIAEVLAQGEKVDDHLQRSLRR